MLLKRYPSQPGAGVDPLAVDFKYRRSTLTIGNVTSAAPNQDDARGPCSDSSRERSWRAIARPGDVFAETALLGQGRRFRVDVGEEEQTHSPIWWARRTRRKKGREHGLGGPDLPEENPPSPRSTPRRSTRSQGDRIAEYAGLESSEDGSAVYFGVHQWEDKKKPPTGNPTTSQTSTFGITKTSTLSPSSNAKRRWIECEATPACGRAASS